MKTKQLTLLASAIMLCPIGSVAQNSETASTSMVKIEAGVKTYYPTKMGFSQNEPISNVIKMITMYKEEGVFTYSLMVNGENYLQSKEMFFAHTLVGDVERIEIITDPNLCGNTIGTDGNINIVLRNKEEGTHGRVGFQIETNNSHIPAFNISHKADKWTVWGNYVGNISHSKSEKNEYGDTKDASSNYANTHLYSITENSKEKINALDFGLNYKDEKNSITIEVNNYDAPSTINRENKVASYYIQNKNTENVVKGFSAILDFKHTINDKWSYGLNISKERGKGDSDISTTNYFEATNYIRIKSNLTQFNIHADYFNTNNFSIKAGIMGSWGDNNVEKFVNTFNSEEHDVSRITPYALAQINLGKFKITAGERLSFNNIEETQREKATTMTLITEGTGDKSFNSSLTTTSVEWKPNANHNLMASHSYHATRECNFVSKNNAKTLVPRLDEMDFHVYNVNYAYTNENVNAGLKAQYTRINCVYPDAYNSYDERTRTNDVDLYDITASVTYHKDMFAVTSDLNFYKYDGKIETTGASYYYSDENYEYTSGNYWIFRITPMLSFANNINVSASAIFASHRVDKEFYYWNMNDERQLEKWLTLRISKSWKNLDLYVKWENAFDKCENYYEADYINRSTSNRYASEDKFDNRLTFGGSFRF